MISFAAPKKKRRNCQKGYPCGQSCISKTYGCQKALKGQAKTYGEWLKSKVTDSAPPLSGSGADGDKQRRDVKKEATEPSIKKITAKSAHEFFGDPASLWDVDTTGVEANSLSRTHLVSTNPRLNPNSLDEAFDALATTGASQRVALFRKFVNKHEVQAVFFDASDPSKKQLDRLIEGVSDRSYTQNPTYKQYYKLITGLDAPPNRPPGSATEKRYARAAIEGASEVSGFTSPLFSHVVIKSNSKTESGAGNSQDFKVDPAVLNNAVQKAVKRAKQGDPHDILVSSIDAQYQHGNSDTSRFVTYLHEIGHQVHNAAGSPLFNSLGKPLNSDFKSLSDYGKSKSTEWFAEHFAAWMLDAEAYRNFDPAGADFIEDSFKKALLIKKKSYIQIST